VKGDKANRFYIAALCLLMAACSGGGGSGGDSGGGDDGDTSANFDCNGACTHQSLSTADVTQILEQAVAATTQLATAGTFAVVDRVGNVLAVYQMPGATPTTMISGGNGAQGGLEGIAVPASLAVISKAGTGAYLSSQGNGFSTRTASQIIQENFNPGEKNAPGGPLSGVQFSQLLCSDITIRNATVAAGIPAGTKISRGGQLGPRALPLGLAADPGGIPLYKQGDLVGGIGVEIDGVYTLDLDIRDYDDPIEERVALAASVGFGAPSERVASQMYVAGRSLRYTDLGYDDLVVPEAPAALNTSNLLAIPEFTAGTIVSGATFGTAASGILNTVRAGVAASSLVFEDGTARYPTRAGSALPGGAQLSATEVDALLDSALLTASRTRAAIRRPLDSAARVSIWIIDTQGNPLGFIRSQDAPIFGIDVSLQKARTATFFSSPDVVSVLAAARANNSVGTFADWSAQIVQFLGVDFPGSAFGARSIGNLARPFFVDGINGNSPGPLSYGFPGTSEPSWSPFNTGLQLELVFQRLVAPLGVPAAPTSLPDSCTSRAVFGSRLANGLQIFAGGVPLYRGATLIGGIGVSGDGIDQDDMTAFYGASANGLQFAGHATIGDPVAGFNAPTPIRADTLTTPEKNTRLRYANCPEGPFVGSNEQNVCEGF